MLRIFSYVATVFMLVMLICSVLVMNPELDASVSNGPIGDFYFAYGVWYPNGFNIEPFTISTFWLWNFIIFAALSAILTIASSVSRRNYTMGAGIEAAAKHVLEQEFGGSNAESLERKVAMIAASYSPYAEGRAGTVDFLNTLRESLDGLENQLAPVIDIRQQIARVEAAGEEATIRLASIAAEETELNSALVALKAAFQPVLDRSETISLHLTDVAELGEKLQALSDTIGEGGAEGVRERITSLEALLRKMGRDTTTLIDNPLGDHDSMRTVLGNLLRKLEGITRVDVVEEQLMKLTELEGKAASLQEEIGDPEAAVKRVEDLANLLAELKRLDEKVWYPLDDGDSLADVVLRLEGEVNELDQTEVTAQVEAIEAIQSDVATIITAIKAAAARFTEEAPAKAS